MIDQMQGMSRREEAVTFLDALNRTLAAVDAALLATEIAASERTRTCPPDQERLQLMMAGIDCLQAMVALS